VDGSDGGMDKEPAEGHSTSEKLFLVDSRILPEAIRKTAEVWDLLKRGEASSVGEAAKRVGISRSAFYRYKDYIQPFNEATRQKIVTLSIELEHRSGVLSRVLNTVAEAGGNILTINQGIPLHGTAMASLAIETACLKGDFGELLEILEALPGVKTVEIVGKS
jgi:chorismate mutase